MMYVDSVRGEHIFGVKGQIANILVFGRHAVSVTVPQFSCCHVKAAIGNTYMSRRDCAPIKLYLQKQVGCVWLMDQSLPTLELISFNPYKNTRCRDYYYYFHFMDVETKAQKN